VDARSLFPVVLTYGREQLHLALADDLLSQGVPAGNCVLVHNPTSPGDAWLPDAPQGFRRELMPSNGGYSSGMNRGIRLQLERGAPMLLLLTHDARLRDGAVAAVLAAAERRPDFGLLGFVLDRGTGGVSYGGAQFRDGSVAHLVHPPATTDGVAEVPWVDGSAMAIRGEAMTGVDLPERYFMYFEEAFLCSELRRRGWKAGTVLDAVAESASGATRRPGAHGYLMTRNGLDWVRRERGRRWALRYARHQLRVAWRLWPKPGGERFADPARRRAGHAALAGRALGFADWMRGRWGPPPARLLRREDVRGA
jgi:N-acetylglucosaminyl-diphospho-decaprenol L-rhamnosyltransferase